MITLTAEIRVQGENPSPFRLGVSRLGENLLGASIDNTEVINKRKILSLESEIRDRAEIEKPSFGVISSGGSISFKDDFGRFLNYANMRVLKGNETVNLFLENTISRSKEKIGEFFSEEWSYDNNNKVVSVSFSDDLTNTQEMEQDDISLLNSSETKNLYDFYLLFKGKLENSGLKFGEISDELANYMRKVTIIYPYIAKGSAWNALRKISEVCMCNSYKEKDGLIYTRR